MTLNAQRDIVIGALCSEKQFRDVVFACNDVKAVQDELEAYGTDNGVEFDDIAAVAKDVWRLVANDEGPAFFGDCLKLFCKIWPCR